MKSFIIRLSAFDNSIQWASRAYNSGKKHNWDINYHEGTNGQLVSLEDFNLFPKNLNIPAYIELNYANNFPFTIGILHKDQSITAYFKQALITLVPTYENEISWNKTYLFIPRKRIKWSVKFICNNFC